MLHPYRMEGYIITPKEESRERVTWTGWMSQTPSVQKDYWAVLTKDQTEEMFESEMYRPPMEYQYVIDESQNDHAWDYNTHHVHPVDFENLPESHFTELQSVQPLHASNVHRFPEVESGHFIDPGLTGHHLTLPPPQMTYLPRPSVCYPHSVQPSPLQRSSDDDDPGSRSPPLEVSDEECMRDHITSTTGGEHGKDKRMAAGWCESICTHSEAKTFEQRPGVKKGTKKATSLQEKRQGPTELCRKYKDWTAEDWWKVIFSDEAPFRLFGTSGKSIVGRRKGERYHASCVVLCFSTKGVALS
uniref:Transcription factor PU.1-like n=1 Tax=Sinocyclocheilus grahami TaxID=75366 RepID=A0A672PWM0_SINGR